VKDSFRPQPDLLKIMHDEVLQKISHGVLATQQHFIKEAKNTCTVVPPSTSAQGSIRIKQTIVERNEECLQTIMWNSSSAKPYYCSCNALVHNGMPCTHIIALALHDSEKYKIPYSCFNARFDKDLTEPLTEPTEDPLDQETLRIPQPPTKRCAIPDADSQHII